MAVQPAVSVVEMGRHLRGGCGEGRLVGSKVPVVSHSGTAWSENADGSKFELAPVGRSQLLSVSKHFTRIRTVGSSARWLGTLGGVQDMFRPARNSLRERCMMRMFGSAIAAMLVAAAGIWGGNAMAENASVGFALTEGGKPACDVVVRVAGAGAVVVKTAVGQLNAYVKQAAGVEMPVASRLPDDGPALVAVAGKPPSWLTKAGFAPPAVGPQGFAIRRIARPHGRDWLVVWGETPLGCRYGLVEVLRSLRPGEGVGSLITDLTDLTDAPHFPVRVYYFNFAEHLQNAFGLNTAYDVPNGRWSRDDWRAFLEMLAAMRYTTFEFWLYPTLFSPEALKAPKGSVWDKVAAEMRWVIDEAHKLGIKVEMLQAVNTMGPEWHYHCPNLPAERREILAMWEYWAKRLSNADLIGVFPGDPGGCNRNGCTHETYIDLCLDIVKVTAPHGRFQYDLGTWGTPIWGWGEALKTAPNWDGYHSGVLSGWEGGPDHAKRAMDYLMKRLPGFPRDTIVSINMGFNPESDGDGGGGSSRAYVDEIRKTHQALTWDYAASEGEGAVIPRFRVAKIISRRLKETQWGFAGGINYTMTPKLNAIQAFAASEAYWNPKLTEAQIVDRFSRWAFGAPGVAEQVFPYTEVSGDWGGGGWHGPKGELVAHLANAGKALDAVQPGPRKLPVAPSPQAYRDTLRWYVDLLRRLATIGAQAEELRSISGQPTLAKTAEWTAAAPDGPERKRAAELVAALRAAKPKAIQDEYFAHVYGLYNAVQALPDTAVNRGAKKWRDFSWQNASGLFAAFHWEFLAE